MTTATETNVNTTETAAIAPDSRLRAKPATEGKGLHLSDKAADNIRAIMEKETRIQKPYLYVGVKGGGCSGLQYVLDLRDETTAPIAETDEVYDSHGIIVVCDLKSFIVGNLEGTVIDYQESMMGAGFTFNNPNAKHSCGCGSSYSA